MSIPKLLLIALGITLLIIVAPIMITLFVSSRSTAEAPGSQHDRAS
jgi:flagellar basal body-associated protein FliL